MTLKSSFKIYYLLIGLVLEVFAGNAYAGVIPVSSELHYLGEARAAAESTYVSDMDGQSQGDTLNQLTLGAINATSTGSGNTITVSATSANAAWTSAIQGTVSFTNLTFSRNITTYVPGSFAYFYHSNGWVYTFLPDAAGTMSINYSITGAEYFHFFCVYFNGAYITRCPVGVSRQVNLTLVANTNNTVEIRPGSNLIAIPVGSSTHTMNGTFNWSITTSPTSTPTLTPSPIPPTLTPTITPTLTPAPVPALSASGVMALLLLMGFCMAFSIRWRRK